MEYATSNGTANAGDDYTAATGTLTIAAGDTTGTVTVAILQDTIGEADETFTVTLTNPSAATVSDGDGTGTIADPPPTVGTPGGTTPLTVRVDDARVREGADAQAEFVVRLSGAAPNPITIDYSTSNGTAIAGSDYTETRGTVTIAAGDTEASIFVPIVDDDDAEPDETFTLALSNPTGAAIERGDAVGTILDNRRNDGAAHHDHRGHHRHGGRRRPGRVRRPPQRPGDESDHDRLLDFGTAPPSPAATTRRPAAPSRSPPATPRRRSSYRSSTTTLPSRARPSPLP